MGEVDTALTERETALLARVIAQGAIIELLLGVFLADRDPVGTATIIGHLQKTPASRGRDMSQRAAVSWSKVAVQVPQCLAALLGRALLVTEGLREMDAGRTS